MIRGGGGKSSQKSQQQSQSTQESGVKFNKNFLDELYSYFGQDPSDNPENQPGFTGAQYTPVEGGDFAKLEKNLYDTQASRLRQAYESAVGRQREELSQMGGLNSPAQYLEGSARSSLDRGYLNDIQQSARDAAMQVLGLKGQEAARQTQFSLAEAGRKTQFDTDIAQQLYKAFLNKLTLALEASKYATGQSTSEGTSSGKSVQGQGGILWA